MLSSYTAKQSASDKHAKDFASAQFDNYSQVQQALHTRMQIT
jgi:hypothetical protein